MLRVIGESASIVENRTNYASQGSNVTKVITFRHLQCQDRERLRHGWRLFRHIYAIAGKEKLPCTLWIYSSSSWNALASTTSSILRIIRTTCAYGGLTT